MEHQDSANQPGRPFRAWTADEQLQAERSRLQREIILRSLPDSAVAFGPRRPDGSRDENEPSHIYRRGRILVRDSDIPRVRVALDLGAERREGDDALIDGVTALAVDDTVAALADVDARLGAGVARPDHVLYVVPYVPCPATEPVPALHDNPDPDVRRDPSSTGEGASVVVVDTGLISSLVDARHPWLDGVTGDEESFDATDIGPYVGHGTFIAGIVRCVAPQTQVRVEGFPVHPDTKTHGGAIYESELVRQLDEALQSMPDVVSMSVGCTTYENLPPLALEVLYEKRLRHMKGTVLVCAAGNDGARRPFWPAASPWTISVGALDRDGTRAGYSNFGSWVDVYAVGSDVVNAYPDGTYRYSEPPAVTNGEQAEFTNGMAMWSGTSFATPLFAGMIAARMSRNGQSARQAADSLLRIARAHAQPGIGPVAETDMIGDVDPRH